MATLTGIRIKNFKAVGETPVELKLAPITLLYGPNGAGKSTVLHALHYAREILERGNLDPDRTLTGGELDLGGFRNLVHGRDLEREIVLGFDLMLLHGLSGPGETEFDAMGLMVDPDRLRTPDAAGDASIELTIGWSGILRAPYLARLAIGVEKQPFATIVSSPDLRDVQLTDFNPDNPLLHDEGFTGDEEASARRIENLLFEDKLAQQIGVLGSRGALPDIDRGFSLDFAELDIPDWLDSIEGIPRNHRVGLVDGEPRALIGPEMGVAERRAVEAYINEVICGALAELRATLREMVAIGPLRELPPRGFRPQTSPEPGRWASGLAAWDRLYTANDLDLLRDVSHWLSERLHSGFGLNVRMRRAIESGDRLSSLIKRGPLLDDLENIAEAFRQLPGERQITLFDVRRDIAVEPQDVGIGISQLLPVVVAALDRQAPFVAIEQPELHVHPALQTEVGDLLVAGVAPTLLGQEDRDLDRDYWFEPDGWNYPRYMTNARTFLVETHSEHLILRLLRRIREFGEGALEEGQPIVRPALVAVYYAEPTEDGLRLHRLRVDETGEFIDRWPEGFFAERRKELF